MFPPLYTIIPEIFSSMHLALLHVNCTPICLAFFLFDTIFLTICACYITPAFMGAF